MNKKVLILIGLCAFGLCDSEACTVKPETTPIYTMLNHLPGIFDEIILQGDLMYGNNPNAIEAGASDNAIYIQFNQNFGNVSITIYNGNNLVVYSTVVDTSVQQVVIIPFTTAAADTYTIVLNNANGYAEGDFDKN
jgi:hypothetical protein